MAFIIYVSSNPVDPAFTPTYFYDSNIHRNPSCSTPV